MVLIDSHVHVWDPSRLDYPWLDGLPALDRPMLPDDIDRADGRTTRMVFVQAACLPAQALDEVHWVAGLGGHWPELAGIVADADLRGGGALDAHLDALGAVPLVVGVRHLLQDEPADRLGDRSLRDGLAAVAARGLAFDACVRHPQLRALSDLVDAVPDLTVVLDHLGKPPVDDGADSVAGRRWADGIDRLARRPRTWVKLSGLAPEASGRDGFDRNADAFVVRALEAFGPQRAMLGSDWPVSTHLGAAVGFAHWVDRVRSATGLTGAEWDAVAALSAARCYRLGA